MEDFTWFHWLKNGIQSAKSGALTILWLIEISSSLWRHTFLSPVWGVPKMWVLSNHPSHGWPFEYWNLQYGDDWGSIILRIWIKTWVTFLFTSKQLVVMDVPSMIWWLENPILSNKIDEKRYPTLTRRCPGFESLLWSSSLCSLLGPWWWNMFCSWCL